MVMVTRATLAKPAGDNDPHPMRYGINPAGIL
jgi:hypothetical protein